MAKAKEEGGVAMTMKLGAPRRWEKGSLPHSFGCYSLVLQYGWSTRPLRVGHNGSQVVPQEATDRAGVAAVEVGGEEATTLTTTLLRHTIHQIQSRGLNMVPLKAGGLASGLAHWVVQRQDTLPAAWVTMGIRRPGAVAVGVDGTTVRVARDLRLGIAFRAHGMRALGLVRLHEDELWWRTIASSWILE